MIAVIHFDPTVGHLQDLALDFVCSLNLNTVLVLKWAESDAIRKQLLS